MDIVTIQGVNIAGIVACIPENRQNNETDCADLFGNEVETLIKATGIKGKCIAEPGTTSLDLGICAAKELLTKTQTSPEEIGAVICVTFTPEYLMPADAPAAQARLGIPNECLAFDINMACSGYGYGLYIAGTVAKALKKKVLLLDGDIQTAFVSNRDKSTMPVMADAGTATLLEPSETEPKWNFSFYTDGSQREALFIKAGGSKNPIQKEDLEYSVYEKDGSCRRNADIYMNGFELLKFVTTTAAKYIAEFMDKQNINPETLDIFVPHQANIYMAGMVAKKLKISPEKVWKSGDIYGNPASASIPLTIAANAQQYFESHEGSHTLFSGFGGGLSISVAEIALNRNGYYTVLTYHNKE